MDGQRLIAELCGRDLSRPFHVGVPENLKWNSSFLGEKKEAMEKQCMKLRTRMLVK